MFFIVLILIPIQVVCIAFGLRRLSKYGRRQQNPNIRATGSHFMGGVRHG